MGNAAAVSASASNEVAILGETPGALALARLCSAHGVVVSVLASSSDGDSTPDLAAALKACDVVIDARPLDAASKADRLPQLEDALPAGAIVVLAASHRPVAPLTRRVKRPDRFAGIVLGKRFAEETTPEIVRTPDTSAETAARLTTLLRLLGKDPILVRDSAGFFSGRVAGAFLNEAMALVGEGVPAAQVENAAIERGMRTAPLAMLDELSLKIPDEILHQELHDLEHEKQPQGRTQQHGEGVHVHEQQDPHRHDHVQGHGGHGHGHGHGHEHGHGHGHEHGHEHGHGHDHTHAHPVKSRRMPEPAVYVMEKMAHGYRRMGREAGAGFYDYEDDGTFALWSGLKAFERRTVKVTAEDISDRLLFIQALEAVRCLDEGIVSSVKDANTASLAYGFPSATGGAVGFINSLGTAQFVRRAQELASRYGERFSPPAGLVDLARQALPLADQQQAAPSAVPASPGGRPGHTA